MDRVYLDANATAPLRPEVRDAWLTALDEVRGNPSSLHAPGRAARQLLDEARERVALALDVPEDAVVFTSGGTEANNLAVLGAVRAAGRERGFVTTAIEHASVLGPAERLAEEGHAVAVAGVDAAGRVDPAELVRSSREVRAALVSVGGANGEIGVRAPVEAVRAALDELPERPWLHSDLVQALGRVPLPLQAVDLASFALHKVGGPVGVGLLVRQSPVPLVPLAFGGGHEGGLRPGTENVAGAVAAAVAVELAVAERAAHARELQRLAELFWHLLRAAVPGARLLGPPIDARDARLPGTLSVLFPGVDGKVLVTRLDLAGLEVSAGSACSSGSLEPSHVLRALGLDDDEARAGLRIAIARTTTDDDVHRAVEMLRTTVGETAAR